MTHSDDPQIIARTRHWINEVIVGLNFCPFAKREVQKETIRYTVCHAQTRDDTLQLALDELLLLDQRSEIETTLIILPQHYEQFDCYLQLVEYLEALLDGAGYRGIYQLATFHPQYCFADSGPDDVENYTNRSPFPILHLLRESSIERVLKQYPDPENIPVRNQHKARQLGRAYFRSFLTGR